MAIDETGRYWDLGVSEVGATNIATDEISETGVWLEASASEEEPPKIRHLVNFAVSRT